MPYLTTLLPLVNFVLVDPVPEARATAAKALGTLIERLGEDQFPDMVPSLLRTLKTEASSVDKLGAAQGLSEVLAGLGMERLEALLPDIVSNARSTRSNVREGFMSLLVFLPATFGARFQPHLSKIIGPILSGLSDSEEKVREEALKAGRMIIVNYSNKAIDLLLPELERGMFDASWRIRVQDASWSLKEKIIDTIIRFLQSSSLANYSLKYLELVAKPRVVTMLKKRLRTPRLSHLVKLLGMPWVGTAETACSHPCISFAKTLLPMCEVPRVTYGRHWSTIRREQVCSLTPLSAPYNSLILFVSSRALA